MHIYFAHGGMELRTVDETSYLKNKIKNEYPFFFFFKDFIYFIFRGEGREKERERNINVWLPLVRPLLRTWPSNPGMCPDWESNPEPFGLQASAQSTEPHQPGPVSVFIFAHCFL